MDLWNALAGMPVPVLLALVICLVLVTAYIGYQHAKLKGLDGIRSEVYQLMLQAEHTFRGNKEGLQKLKYVVGRARSLLPGWLQFFVTEDTLMKIIDIWFLEVKDLLDDGKINDSVQDPDIE